MISYKKLLLQMAKGIGTTDGDIFTGNKSIKKTNISEVFSGVLNINGVDKPAVLKLHINEHFNHSRASMAEGFKELEIYRIVQNKSDHIVKYYGNYFSDDYMFIVLEKAECSLSHYIKKHNNPSNHYKFAYQMASGLYFLHSLKRLHCDVKTSNFLVSNGRVLLSDFGKALPTNNGYPFVNATNLTHYRNIPPEISKVTESYITEKFDVWCYGISVLSLFLNDNWMKSLDYKFSEYHYVDTMKSISEYINIGWQLKLLGNTVIPYPSHRSDFKSILSQLDTVNTSSD